MADMVADMVDDMEVEMVADIVANMAPCSRPPCIGAYFEKWRSGYQETLGAILMTEVVSGGHFPVSGGHFLA